MTKWLLGIIAALLVTCFGLLYLYSERGETIESLSGTITDMTGRLKRSEEGRDKERQSCTLTDAGVSVNVEKTEELEKKSQELVDKLDDRLKRVDDAKVPSQNVIIDSRDAIMLDSMWDAYCTAEPDSADCAKRRTSN